LYSRDLAFYYAPLQYFQAAAAFLKDIFVTEVLYGYKTGKNWSSVSPAKNNPLKTKTDHFSQATMLPATDVSAVALIPAKIHLLKCKIFSVGVYVCLHCKHTCQRLLYVDKTFLICTFIIYVYLYLYSVFKGTVQRDGSGRN
jgi:hypothetical protein